MSAVEPTALEARLRQLRAVMRSHGGTIELVGCDAAGVVTLRFAGACCGCPYRPLTLAATIRPALEALPGVSEVRAGGARLSDEALSRIRSYFEGAAPPPLPALPAVPTNHEEDET
ncbi:MAG TPA: NifU family protein [Solirubrobacteraceae bacterium]|nr:NifU family protein [Solirubrobacteraceae bacterium]